MDPTTIRPKVGLVTFTDGRDSFFDGPREKYLRARHDELASYLTEHGCEVIDPMVDLRPDPEDWFGVRRDVYKRQVDEDLR